MYSGYCHASLPFAYGAFTLSGRLSQNRSAGIAGSILQSEPHGARAMVWALPRSLAATYGIDVSFSSSGYLDVSVRRVPLHTLWIGVWIHAVPACGFPHSEIRGSRDICSSPRLIAAYRVFHRLLVPRHPPCALFCLTSSQESHPCGLKASHIALCSASVFSQNRVLCSIFRSVCLLHFSDVLII